MAKGNNFEFRLTMSPLVASSLASLGTGIYVGYSHATGGEASLIAPAITTGLEALVTRNEANPQRKNPDAQKTGKTVLTVAGAGVGTALNAIGYGIGYGAGYLF